MIDIYKKLKELREKKKAAAAAASGIPDATRPRSRSLPAVPMPSMRPPVPIHPIVATTTTVTSPVGSPPPVVNMTIAVSPPTPTHTTPMTAASASPSGSSVELTPEEQLELLDLPPGDPLFLETQASVMWDRDELRPFTGILQLRSSAPFLPSINFYLSLFQNGTNCCMEWTTEPVTLQYVLNLIRHFRDNRLMVRPIHQLYSL
jgi:hypothetical protein